MNNNRQAPECICCKSADTYYVNNKRAICKACDCEWIPTRHQAPPVMLPIARVCGIERDVEGAVTKYEALPTALYTPRLDQELYVTYGARRGLRL